MYKHLELNSGFRTQNKFILNMFYLFNLAYKRMSTKNFKKKVV